MPSWHEKRKGLYNLLAENRPTYGDLYQINLSDKERNDYAYFVPYVEGVINIGLAGAQRLIDGDMLVINDPRPFKIGREFYLVYSVRLQRIGYIYTMLFGTGTAVRLEKATDNNDTPENAD